MQRTNSDASSSLVLPPPCFRKKASSFTAPPAARWNSISPLSIQSSEDSCITSSSSSPFSMATGAAGSTITRSASSPSLPPSSREIEFPLPPGGLDIARESRTSSSPGSLVSIGGQRHSTVDSLDSSALTPTTKHPAVGLGYGCSRFLARLPPHPESLEFVQGEEEKPQIELFRQDSWWKDETIKDVWTQELKQMEEKMKELLREAPPSSPASKESTVKDWMRQLTKTRIGNHNKKEKTQEPISGGAKEVKVQLLQQIHDRLHAYNVAGSLETSGIPLQIAQFNTNNDLHCPPNQSAIGTDNSSSSQKKKKTPEHALTRKKSCGDIQSPLLLDVDQKLEDDAIAGNFSKRQRGDRVIRSMQKALFRRRPCTTESQGPQQRQDTESSIKISEPSPPSPFADRQELDALSTASTPVRGNQNSHQEQGRQEADEDEEDKDKYNIPLAKQSSSIRQAADAFVEGIIGWAVTFDSTKQEKNGQHGDTVVPVTVEPDWHAASDSGRDPIIHIPPLPVQSGGGDDRGDHAENGRAFSRTRRHRKFGNQEGTRSSPFRRFRSRSSSATRSDPHKEAGRENSPNREVTCGPPSSDGDGSPFHFSWLNATTSMSSCEALNKDAVKVSNSVEEDGQRSSSPVLNLKTILKPSASSNNSFRKGHVEKMSKATKDSAEMTMTSACICPLSFDAETDDPKNESGLENTRVSFGKDPFPFQRNRKKVRFMRCTAEKVIPNEGVESETIASIGEIIEAFMVMTGCPAEPEAEFDDYSLNSYDEDSRDGQGSSSIRTDGSLNEFQASINVISTMMQRSPSPVEMIREAFRTVLETPSTQEGTGAGLEAPLESKKSSSSTTGIRGVRILPNRLMRQVLGRNLSKRQARAISDPELLQRVNTIELMVNETLANLRESLSQRNETTCDRSPHAYAATPPSQNIEHKNNSFEDEGIYSATLFSPGKASPTMQGECDWPSAPPEAPGRQRSATRFMKQVLRRRVSQDDHVILLDDSKEFEAWEWKGVMDQNDSNDRRVLAVTSTSSTLPTKAEHSGPFPEKQGGTNESAQRERRQKRNPENDDVDDKPQHNDDSGMPGRHCMCDTPGNTPNNRVPNQVVCDNKYLFHEELLAKKGRCSSDITENERQQTNGSLPETPNGARRLHGSGSFREATHQPKVADDGSQSDESVNQMVVEWLVDSLTFKNLLDQVEKTMRVKGKAESPMFNLFLCASPPISPALSPSTEDCVTTFGFCKADSYSTDESDEMPPMQEDETAPNTRRTTRRTAEPKKRRPPGYGRRDGGIGEIHSEYSKAFGKERSTLRRQKNRRTFLA